MIGEILSLLVAVARSWFVARSRLEAEILLLRHQLNVLRRSATRRPRLSSGDRPLFVWLYRLWPGVLRSLTLLRPETVVRIARDFEPIGAGSRRAGQGVRQSARTFEISFMRSAVPTRYGARREFTANS